MGQSDSGGGMGLSRSQEKIEIQGTIENLLQCEV